MRPSWFVTLYARLLGVFPRPFRDFHRTDLLASLEDSEQSARALGTSALWRFRIRELAHLLAGAMSVRTRRRLPTSNEPKVQHDPRASWITALVTETMQDIRFAIRSFSRTPAFTSIAVVTIALGVGANTAIFSIVNGVLLKPLGYRDSEELVTIWEDHPGLDFHRLPVTVGAFVDLREQNRTLEGVAARWSTTRTLLSDGEPEEFSLAFVTENYFPLLSVTPVLGRNFSSGEQNSFVIISHQLWRRRWASDPDILGQTIQLSSGPAEVIGVLPEEPNANLVGTQHQLEDSELWFLMPEDWFAEKDYVNGWLRVFARIRDGVTLSEARSDLGSIALRVREVSADHKASQFSYDVQPLLNDIVSPVKPTLMMLLGAVGFVLLIACANVANLLMVRAQGRSREIAIRAALGGGRGQIVRQLVTESGILALAGGTLGVGLAYLAVQLVIATQPMNLARVEMIHLDGRVLAFALGASLLSALLFGLVPSFRASKVNLADSLKVRASTLDRGHRRLSRSLIVAEVALSLVLLFGAGLLLRTFTELRAVRPGYDTRGILSFSVTAPGHLERGEAVGNFFRQLRERTDALPGVEAVGTTMRFPLAGGLFAGPYATEAIAASEGREPEASFRYVSPDFFTAMGTKLLAGRFFREGESEDAVIVDQKAAEIMWPGEDPIGKRLRTGVLGRDGEWSTVVGVVEHMRHANLHQDGRETVFFPDGLFYFRNQRLYFAVRANGEPLDLAAQVKAVLKGIDPAAAIARIRTIRELVGNALAPTQFALILIAIFAGLAVMLAGVGLYGVISYSVSQRTREIGIRVAFGARQANIMRLIVGQGLKLTALGVLVGVLGGAALSQLMASLLFGVTPTDPLTFAGVSVLLLLIGVLGSYLPARRALKVDPKIALSAE